MYEHLGHYKGTHGYIHLYFSLKPEEFRIEKETSIDTIKYPACILFVAHKDEAITEFVRKKVIKRYHYRKQEKGFIFFYMGVHPVEFIDQIEKLGKHFFINQNGYKKVVDTFVIESI